MSLEQLLDSVATARSRYIGDVQQLTEAQARWKPDPDAWSAVDITEHLYWAEHGGIWGMWRILQDKRDGKPPVWTGELIHRGLPIEEIVARTWQVKEKVPPIAAPRMGGSVAFWLAALESLQQPLTKLSQELADEDFEAIIHPHPISGPLDVGQRFEFLRFHIDRHRNQVAELRAQMPV
ncbi:DinB family protein [Larkinella sp. VNQ87]|uniref:DinB family protein n=1 Tax=Larkinella sp. VNQ87 TaxID=3400921 RepID=UPI003BFB3733